MPEDRPTGSSPGDLAETWRELRSDPDIQFDEVPLPQQQPPETPDWLADMMRWLSDALSPLGEGLVQGWPALKWVLLALAIALLGYILWQLFGPDLQGRHSKPGHTDWTPNQQAALALLDQADLLAAEGRYDEATHLLLQRSVGQIAEARPDLVEPSSTAREIAAQPSLPANVRRAFAVIAERVERSLFALRKLTADDWQVARSAYADFALAQESVLQGFKA